MKQTALEYLKDNSDWFDKSPGGENLYFESEVIKMMENYSPQTETSDDNAYTNGYLHGYNAAISELPKEISDKEIFYQKQVMNPYPSTKHFYTAWEKGFIECAKWYREQLKSKN